MNKFFVGIDPGVNGVIAVIDRSGNYYWHIRLMPDKWHESMSHLNSMHSNLSVFQGESLVGCEEVNAWGQGRASAFTFGQTFAVAKIAASYLAMGDETKIHMIRPQDWKNYFVLDGKKLNKYAGLELARRMFPEAPLDLKKDADLADALLIAEYVRSNLLKTDEQSHTLAP